MFKIYDKIYIEILHSTTEKILGIRCKDSEKLKIISSYSINIATISRFLLMESVSRSTRFEENSAGTQTIESATGLECC